jgi:hypothetical protein
VKCRRKTFDLSNEGLQAILEEVSPSITRQKNQAEELVDRRFLDEMTASGFFDQLWGKSCRVSHASLPDDFG